MAQKAEFIKVSPSPNGLPQTNPVEPSRRIPRSDISVSEAVDDDLPKIVEGLYSSFPQEYWNRKEPLEKRPQSEAIRHERMIKRMRPTLSLSHNHWVVVKYIPTGEIIASACWTAPGNPVHSLFNKSAVDFYGWKHHYGSDEEFKEAWSHVDDEQWSGYFTRCDAVRKEVLGDEPHWYLASLFTWPEWQGRGAGKLLLEWAISRADANTPPTPMYLESAPTAMPVYMHCGFVPKREYEYVLVRRGPAIVRSLEAHADKGHVKATQTDTDAIAVEKSTS